MSKQVWEYACQDIPVWDVCAANHGGKIGDGVARHTGLVEAWVLANEMTGQETTMGAPGNCHLLRVELVAFQNTFNSELVGKTIWKECRKPFVVEKKRRKEEKNQ